jgi:hypothetical protein
MKTTFFIRLKTDLHEAQRGELVRVFTNGEFYVLATDADRLNQRIVPFHLADLH